MHIREAVAADAPGIARVHVESWRSTYTRLVPPEGHPPFDRRLAAWRVILAQPDRHGFTFVADEPVAGIVGFANGGRERHGNPRFRGELYAVYLLEPWQRRGHGRRLVAAVATWLLGSGIRSLLAWTLADNPACRFYERLGGCPVDEKEVALGGRRLREVAYGWDDTVAAGLVDGGAAPRPAGPAAGTWRRGQ